MMLKATGPRAGDSPDANPYEPAGESPGAQTHLSRSRPLYDVITFATSSTVVFVAAGWARNSLTSRKPRQLAIAAFGLIAGIGAVIVLATIFMYLE